MIISRWILLSITLQTKIVQTIKTHILYSIIFSENRAVYKIYKIMWKKYVIAGQATDGNIIRRMRFACWISKAKDTHWEYVILIAFQRQQLLCECAWVWSYRYTRVNKNPSAWNFLSPEPEVTCGTVAIIIRVVLLSPYLRIRGVSPSPIHYSQSHRVYINRRQQYICLIWN